MGDYCTLVSGVSPCGRKPTVTGRQTRHAGPLDRRATLHDLGHAGRHHLDVAARSEPGWLDAADYPRAFALPVALPSIAFSVLVEFGDVWMMRKMLLNLRDRAEAA
jgi:hypothetical protein